MTTASKISKAFARGTFDPRHDRPRVRRTFIGLIACSVLLVLLPLMSLSNVQARLGFRVPLEQIPQGVSAHDVDASRVFLVRTADQVIGFEASDPSIGTQLWWCPSEQVFLAPSNGEVFNIAGRLLFGGSPVDMRRFEVDVAAMTAYLRPSDRLPDVAARPIGSKDALAAIVRTALDAGDCTSPLT